MVIEPIQCVSDSLRDLNMFYNASVNVIHLLVGFGIPACSYDHHGFFLFHGRGEHERYRDGGGDRVDGGMALTEVAVLGDHGMARATIDC